jgi:preprotein translocase subunit SecB
MKIKQAPLILHDFFVIETKYKFNNPENQKINVKETFNNYEIDFDFIAREQKNGEIFLFAKIHIKDIENPLPGYVIFVEGAAIFSFDKNIKLTEKEQSDYLYVSGLGIAINSLRSYIANTTSCYPFGKFQLPSIDLGALHIEKEKLQKKKKVEKK